MSGIKAWARVALGLVLSDGADQGRLVRLKEECFGKSLTLRQERTTTM